MQEIIKKLITLQSIDTRIAEINAVIMDMPLQVQNIKEQLERSIKGHATIKQELEANKLAYITLETDLKQKKEMLESSQKKLTSVQNNKEYQSVLREQDSLKKSITDGDTKLKDMTAANFKYESEYASVEELKSSLEKSLNEMQSSKKDADKELHEELETLTLKRLEQIKGIKNSELSKYDRIRNYRHNLAIASVLDEVCNGCYMRIPPQLYVDVKRDKSLYSCPHCQRILYYETPEA